MSRALRETAARLEGGARYEWGHVGRCNCGHLAQTVAALDDRAILRLFGQELGEWSEHARGRCAATNQDLEALFQVLHKAGLSRTDLLHLEHLSDPAVLRRLPDERRRALRRNERADVAVYMRALADEVEAVAAV
jgi:hypothetical protein